jgi:hypothetical protein
MTRVTRYELDHTFAACLLSRKTERSNHILFVQQQFYYLFLRQLQEEMHAKILSFVLLALRGRLLFAL